MSVESWIVQFIVLIQPIIWEMWYSRGVGFGFVQTNLMFFLLTYGIYVSGAEYAFYNNQLVIFYSLMTWFSYVFYSLFFRDKQALGLSFITVFLNSFYWELPYHVADIIQNIFYPAMLVQWWRLYPILFLRKQGWVYDWKWIKIGVYTSIVIMVFKYGFLAVRHYTLYLNFVNRFICLLILLRVIVQAKKGATVND